MKPALLLLALAAGSAAAQTAAPPAAAASAPAASQRVEVTGARPSEDAERRQSTTTRIVIGREQIDKFGDSTLGEVLRRLPGVTTPGAPGRGGAPRLRGLGGGYTQILLDGQRTPPGFSIESINPDQVERIEILRAPTAETGTRAIAGTINIITREGFKRRINDLRLGFGAEAGRITPGVSWTRNDALGPGAYNLSVSALDIHRRSDSTTDTTETLPDGRLQRSLNETALTLEHRRNLNVTARLQMPLNAEGDALVLSPTLFHTEGTSRFTGAATDTGGLQPPAYASAFNAPHNHFTNARLGAQWRTRLGSDLRLELNGGVGQARSASHNRRAEFDAAGAALGELADDSTSRQTNANLTAKLSQAVGEAGTLVGGLELESTRRRQTRSTEDTRIAGNSGSAQASDDDGALEAHSRRAAAYGQYEWTLNPRWSAYAGLRWEGLFTDGTLADGTAPKNRSSVWTPLAHAVWKPDPKGRDQVRMSFTRSYRSPDLGNLIALRSVSAQNSDLRPDRAGNPALRPELSTGLDLAYEHYLAQGGLLAANLFHRRITQLIRTLVTRESVAGTPRWVARPQNIGNAWTQGLELEARFRLDQLWEGAPPTELRSNASVFRSRVARVPGPDNRLVEQPDASINLGADHRLRGTPLTVGGNLNLVPGYRTQLTDKTFVEVTGKHVLDVYALWTINADTALRLLANNAAPADYTSTSGTQATTQDLAATTTRSRIAFQLRLELRL